MLASTFIFSDGARDWHYYLTNLAIQCVGLIPIYVIATTQFSTTLVRPYFPKNPHPTFSSILSVPLSQLLINQIQYATLFRPNQMEDDLKNVKIEEELRSRHQQQLCPKSKYKKRWILHKIHVMVFSKGMSNVNSYFCVCLIEGSLKNMLHLLLPSSFHF